MSGPASKPGSGTKRRCRTVVDAKKTTPRQMLLEVEKELGTLFFEREEEIRGLTAPFCAGSTCCSSALPARRRASSPKSSARGLRSPYFLVQLTRTSTPKELFESVCLKVLEQNSYRKTTGMLPEAKVAFKA
jgi:hypothetical protein